MEVSHIDEIYSRMNDDLEVKYPENLVSEVQQFYAGKTLFITGITGFMGKCLIAKLLKSCPDLKHIYILLRGNKNLTYKERYKKYFAQEIFDTLRKNNPNFEKKVTAIKGDLSEENLGLSKEDREILKKETNIIIHNGANVRFDIKVSLSLKVNVLGTKYLLDLADECDNLEIFMYVSTAYSHCYQKNIEEVCYTSPADMSVIYNMIEADLATDGLSEETLKMLLGDYPNIYTFSKAVSEGLVRQNSKNSKHTCGIYRPAIVLSSVEEPLPGWCDNFNGPVVVFLATGLGIIHIGYNDSKAIDFIPVDYTINALLVVTWDLHDKWNKEKQTYVYNYGSSSVNKIDLQTFYNNIVSIVEDSDRSRFAISWNCVYIISNFYIFLIFHVIVHFIPACLADVVLMLMGHKPRAVKLWWKVTRRLDLIDYFGNGNWRIQIPNTLEAIDRLNAVDRNIFYCDIRKLSWNDYPLFLWRGLRLYLLKEDLNSNENLKRTRLLYIQYYVCLTMFILLIGYSIFKILF